MPASTTIIAALKYQDGVVVAADSQASDVAARVRWPVDKLDRLQGHPCVIGFSGSVGKADLARAALTDRAIHGTTFDRIERIQRLLADAFAPIYERIQRENHPPAGVPDIALWGLIAMWAENEPRILEFEINGDSSYHPHFHAIGSGASTAYAIYRTLGGRRLLTLDEPKATMAILRILRTCVDVELWGVSEPVDIWNVSATGARRLNRDEVQTHLQAVDAWEEGERVFLFGHPAAPGEDGAPPPAVAPAE